MSQRLAVHVDDNNSANGFFVLRLPEICGRKAEGVIEHGGKGKRVGTEGLRKRRVEPSRKGWRGQRIPMPWECFHLRPTTNKCAPVSGFYNWPEVVQLRKHDAAGWALLHFESFLSLSFLFCLSPFDAPLLLSPFFFVLFAPAYSITTDATDSSLSTSLLRRDISRGWMNNQDNKSRV